MKTISEKLDKVATSLESVGSPHLAFMLDKISNTLEKYSFIDLSSILELQHQITPWKIQFTQGHLELRATLEDLHVGVSLEVDPDTKGEDSVVRIDFNAVKGHEDQGLQDNNDIWEKSAVIKYMEVLAEIFITHLDDRDPLKKDLEKVKKEFKDLGASKWKTIYNNILGPYSDESIDFLDFEKLMSKYISHALRNSSIINLEEITTTKTHYYSDHLDDAIWDTIKGSNIKILRDIKEGNPLTLKDTNPLKTVGVVGLGLVEGLRWLFKNHQIKELTELEVEAFSDFEGDNRRANLYKRAIPKVLPHLLGVSVSPKEGSRFKVVPPLTKL